MALISICRQESYDMFMCIPRENRKHANFCLEIVFIGREEAFDCKEWRREGLRMLVNEKIREEVERKMSTYLILGKLLVRGVYFDSAHFAKAPLMFLMTLDER